MRLPAAGDHKGPHSMRIGLLTIPRPCSPPARPPIKAPTPLHPPPAPTDAATSSPPGRATQASPPLRMRRTWFCFYLLFAAFGIHVSSPVRNRTVDVGEKLAMGVCLRQVPLLMRADDEKGGFYYAGREKPGDGTERGDQIADRGRRHRAAALCHCFAD